MFETVNKTTKPTVSYLLLLDTGGLSRIDQRTIGIYGGE